MRKMLVVLMLVMCACSVKTEAAQTLQWFNAGTVRDVDGVTLLPTGSDYYVMLVQAASSSSIGFNPSTLTVGASETLLWTETYQIEFPDGDGGFLRILSSSDPVPPGSSGIGGLLSSTTYYLYTVILNASTPGAASYYTILDGSTPTSVTISGSNNGSYIAPGNNTWQPVPEPSSIALLGLGLGLVALRRKMRK